MAIASLMIQDTSTDIGSELAAVALELNRCTVQVRSQHIGSGSGVIWHSDGLIVTNAHVAQDERLTVELSDGRVLAAVRTAIDLKRDLAVLRVEATDLPTVTVGDANALRVGELVLAVGNPQGVVGALTTGIIHRIGSTDIQSRQKWVIADVRLAPGNSGGPLANARGEVIGINTMIAGGLALAIPSHEVERFLTKGCRPYLGVTLRPVQVLLENRTILGLLVLDVAKDSLAIASGLIIGDVLIGVCGQYFHTLDDLVNVLEQSEPGESLRLEFLRNGKRDRCTVVLPGSVDSADKSFVGVKSPCSR
jgi:serine protease Do